MDYKYINFKTIVIFTIIIALVIGFVLTTRTHPDTRNIAITTDKTEYKNGDLVKITIRNIQDNGMAVYSQVNCEAIGSFYTVIEKYENGEWKYLSGYCTINRRLFEKIEPVENGFFRHTISPNNSFQLDIFSIYKGNVSGKNERMRAVYYLDNEGKIPVYSNDFIVMPGNGLTVTTEKKEYHPGETINITLKNDLSDSIYSHFGSKTPVYSIEYIERKTRQGRKTLFAQCQPPRCIQDIDAPAETLPGQSRTFEWGGLYINETGDYARLGKDNYYLVINYQVRRGNNSEDFRWLRVYSSDFTIK